MRQGQHDLRFREEQTARWGVTRARHRAFFLVVAGCLGVTLGLGLGPMVGALVDASRSEPPTTPGALLVTAATRLREFQYGVTKLRMGLLVDMIATNNVKSNPIP